MSPFILWERFQNEIQRIKCVCFVVVFEHFVTIIIPCFPIFDTAFSRNVLQLLPHFWIGTRNRKGQIPCHISGQWNGAGCEPLLWSKKHAQQGWFEVDVRKEDVTAPDVIALLQDHLKSMTMHSPPKVYMRSMRTGCVSLTLRFGVRGKTAFCSAAVP